MGCRNRLKFYLDIGLLNFALRADGRGPSAGSWHRNPEVVMRNCILIHVFGCLAVGLTACGEGKAGRETKAESAAVPPGKSTVGRDLKPSRRETYPFGQGIAVVKGEVKVTGSVPKPLPLEMTPDCQKAHGDQKFYSESVVAGPGGELRDCFVFVSAGLEKYWFEPPETVVKIDQVGCRYEPHAVAFMAGQTLEFRNSDPFAHNVHDSRDQFCKHQPRQGETGRYTFQDPVIGGMLKCDIHPWMNCVYAAFEHPFFAVTSANGACAMPQKLLPGKYTVSCYHHVFKYLAKEIEVRPGDETVDISFEFKRDK